MWRQKWWTRYFIEQTLNMLKMTSFNSPKLSKLTITHDDSKVLGNYKKKLEKSLPPSKYGTDSFKTSKSAWTPIVHKVSNNQIFQERKELISNWFDLWTDNQRKHFLYEILSKCRRKQLFAIHDWFEVRVPLRHLDFTTVLPKFLSIYIFSFLDPLSLCRAGSVCWHWKFLTEQDQLWMPKCIRLGWFLPYSPATNEYGAWKKHYIACVATLDMTAPNRNAVLYGTLCDVNKVKMNKERGRIKRTRHNKVNPVDSKKILESRKPWLSTDRKPRDLSLSSEALLYDFNPNDPDVKDKATTLYHNKIGILKTAVFKLSQSCPTRNRTAQDVYPNVRNTLSKSVELEQFQETRLHQLVDQPWEPPARRLVPQRKNLAGGSDYPLPWAVQNDINKRFLGYDYLTYAHPRIVLISSRIPAAEVLVDAVMFGVIPIVYEYEGTTLESLLTRIDQILEGRHAQSMGIFGHSEIPGEVSIVHGCTLDLEELENPSVREFIVTIGNHTLPTVQGGHIDIFAPVGACVAGMELLDKLQSLTGVQFSSPISILRNYNHFKVEWIFNPNGRSPPTFYFAPTKFDSWSNSAEIVKEACSITKEYLKHFFDESQYDLMAQITGQIIFDASGVQDIVGENGVAASLVEGLISMTKEKNVNPLEYLGWHLLKKAGILNEEVTMKEALNCSQQKPTDIEMFNDRRTAVGKEILASEYEYVQVLEIIRDEYLLPLRASIASNRAILSAGSCHSIFQPVLVILELSRKLLLDLQAKLTTWEPQQCIGDVFLSFSAKLKVYTNYLNNYPVILKTIERCIEEAPGFRAFLNRHNRTAKTKMMTLQELLLAPTRRINEYISLLRWFESYTPIDHTDRNNLRKVIPVLEDLDIHIRNVRCRMDQERKIQQLQKRIINTPILLEENRFFIRHEDFQHLRPPAEDFLPEYRVYQCIEMLGLFLFNDALLVSRRTTEHFPFERSVEHTYYYEASLSLSKIKVTDIPDSKYVKNAFIMSTANRKWYLATDTFDAKFNWMTVLENAVRTVINPQ